jgi:DNA-binding response OmpR family regulator/two-component sensor histidine kinase
LIISPVQTLLANGTNEASQKELAIVHRNAVRLTELIDQILDLSKLEAGQLTLQISQHNLKELLKVSAASFESLADAQSIDFHVNISEAPEVAFYDADKVQTILNNLLSNAFKFTPNGGRIELKLKVKQHRVFISVVDTGPGITEADQKVIFQRYRQGSASNESTAGTGVGLTLSKELALLHKGDIDVESTPGKGTTFTVHFPINRESYPSSAFQSTQVGPKVAINNVLQESELGKDDLLDHQQIVLIVEDNVELRQHMQSLLKDSFTVKQAKNGEEGVEIAQQIVPDVIISDLMMPVMDGVELCKSIKENDKTSHIPVILLTAKADKETRLSGLKTGADDFLTKPFDNDELQVRVHNLISQRRALQEKFSRKLTLSPSKIETESPNDRFIRKALETVEQHLSNAEFTVEQFQEEMAMSRMQLHRKLKALTGFSASEFVRDIRLQRAADLLTQEGINVTEVAYSCGFNSNSYFTQCFKEKYGTSPSKYLQKAS